MVRSPATGELGVWLWVWAEWWRGNRPPVTQSLLFSCSYQNGRSVSKRGVSCQFGPDVTKAFLEENQLDYIIRSHEVKAEGYEVAHGGRCVTVFSAPNYWCVLPSHPLPGHQVYSVWIMLGLLPLEQDLSFYPSPLSPSVPVEEAEMVCVDFCPWTKL